MVVALEQLSSDQAAIDAFMDSDGGPAAQSRFIKASIWQGSKDGRSSEAFFRLFERLRQMHHQGRMARVVAFVDDRPAHDPPGDQEPYERRLAAIVRHAAEPGSTVVVLVGNAHARKTKIDFGDSSRKPFMPMAGLLPADRTLTLDAVGNGGTAWFCSGPKPEDCGPHDAGALRESHPRGVELEPVMGGAYNGVLELGVPTTASPPQTAP